MNSLEGARGILYAQGLITGKMLREVNIKGRKLYKPVITTRYGVPDYTIHGEDIIYGGLLTDRLEGRIPGVMFTQSADPERVVAVKRLAFHGVMRVVVDGSEMPAGFSLNAISTSLIDKVEIMTNPTVGDMNTEGAILITLKHGFSANEISSKGILPIKAVGFYQAREFYSPKYASPDTLKLADFRTTIYWNPQVTTGTNGAATFDYFNADGRGNYRMVIEGIDEKGNLGRRVFRYKAE